MTLRLVANNGQILDHKYHKCAEDHCTICRQELTYCDACGSFEGATTTHCPRRKMTIIEIDLVYKGRLDFELGYWRPKASGSCFSHYQMINGIAFINGRPAT